MMKMRSRAMGSVGVVSIMTMIGLLIMYGEEAKTLFSFVSSTSTSTSTTIVRDCTNEYRNMTMAMTGQGQRTSQVQDKDSSFATTRLNNGKNNKTLRMENSNAMCQHLQHLVQHDIDDHKISDYYSHIEYSFGTMMQRLKPPFLNASFTHILDKVYGGGTIPDDDPYGAKQTINDGLQRLMNLFTPHRVRSSFMHPMPTETVRKLANILHRRLSDPQSNPPLHIMMLGGSVVFGVSAALLNEGNVTLNGNEHQARSSAQWQVIFDVIFPSGTVVVTNMAVGGMSSDLASIVLKYAVWPEGYPGQGPDVVISAHGVNDIGQFANPPVQPDENLGYKNMLHANHLFIKAAYSNRCDGLPAIILVDDSFTDESQTVTINLMHSRVVSELATWHDVMAVSYTRSFLKYTYSDQTLGTPPSAGQPRPSAQVLWGYPTYGTHPTLFSHVGLAWLLSLSFLQTMQDYCQDDATQQPQRRTHFTQNSSIQELNSIMMPEFHHEKFLADVAHEWNNATISWKEKCSDPNYKPGNTCSYYWIVHRATNVFRKGHVKDRIGSVATFISGWEASGKPIQQPRTGWIATQPNATFEIKIVAQPFPIRKVTIIYMKSYGDKWADSRLRVDLTVGNVTTGGELTGVHSSSTSVNYDHVFPVDADVGDSVVARFTLVGGTTFKISGMLFCVL